MADVTTTKPNYLNYLYAGAAALLVPLLIIGFVGVLAESLTGAVILAFVLGVLVFIGMYQFFMLVKEWLDGKDAE